MHDNVDIMREMSETKALFEETLLTVGNIGGGGGGESGGGDAQLNEIAADILGKLPPNFDIETASKKYPVVYQESMNTVLVQEMERYNKCVAFSEVLKSVVHYKHFCFLSI